jgi:hypothetical protein
MFLGVDGGRSRIYNSGTSQGARSRNFLALMVALLDLQFRHLPGSLSSIFFTLMVGALGSPLATARGTVVDIFYVDGGRSRISVSTS